MGHGVERKVKRLVLILAVLIAAPVHARQLPVFKLYAPLLGDVVRAIPPQSGAAAGGGGTTLTDSASLRSALSDETGTGLAVFGTSPTISAPLITGDATFGTAAAAANAIDIGETAGAITFEGSSADAFEVRLIVANPAADANWTIPDLGSVAASPIFAALNAYQGFGARHDFTATPWGIVMGANSEIAFGDNAADASWAYATAQTPDSLVATVGPTSNAVHIKENADKAYDAQNGNCATAACTDPELIIHSHNQSTTEYLAMYHDGSNAQIKTGAGSIVVNNITPSAIELATNVGVVHVGAGGTGAATIWMPSTLTPDAPVLSTNSLSNSWHVAEAADVYAGSYDFQNCSAGSSAATDPLLCVHSHNQTTTEWIDLRHNGTNGILDVGAGKVSIPDGILTPVIVASGSAPAVSNTSAVSCGTSAATITGTDTTGVITTGTVGGTSCTLTFNVAATTRRQCWCSNETTLANVCNTHYTDTTHTNVVGTFVAGDIVNYGCLTY